MVQHIRDKINAPRRNDKKNTRNEFKDLNSTKMEFVTLLIVLRTYPPFKKDYETDQRFKDAYNALDRVNTETEVKIQANKLQNPKNQLPVMDWNVVAAIKRTFRRTQQRVDLHRHVRRGRFSRRFGITFVDTSTQYQVPQVGNKAQIDSVAEQVVLAEQLEKEYEAGFAGPGRLYDSQSV